MGQIRSTVKFTIVIAGLVIISFFTFVGLTRQEWMGTVFPEEVKNKMLRIEDHEEQIKIEQSKELPIAQTDEPTKEETKLTVVPPTTVKFQGKNFNEGDIIRLYNVYFDLDKSDLKPNSNEELLKIINLLKKYPSLHVEISGHERAGDGVPLHAHVDPQKAFWCLENGRAARVPARASLMDPFRRGVLGANEVVPAQAFLGVELARREPDAKCRAECAAEGLAQVGRFGRSAPFAGDRGHPLLDPAHRLVRQLGAGNAQDLQHE